MRKILSMFQTKPEQPWNEGIKPRTQSTVYPDVKLSYNDVFVNIYDQLKPIK